MTVEKLLTSANVADLLGSDGIPVKGNFAGIRGTFRCGQLRRGTERGWHGQRSAKVPGYNGAMSALPKLMKPARAAEYVGMSRRDFDLCCRRKNAPPAYLLAGRLRRYAADDLDRWRDPVPCLMAELLATEFRRGWVYFLQAEGGGNIKIGYASTLRDRVADIRACSPVWLEFLGAFPGCMNEEARLHRFFAEHRLHGEWFAPAPLLLRLAAEITSGFRLVIQDL